VRGQTVRERKGAHGVLSGYSRSWAATAAAGVGQESEEGKREDWTYARAAEERESKPSWLGWHRGRGKIFSIFLFYFLFIFQNPIQIQIKFEYGFQIHFSIQIKMSNFSKYSKNKFYNF